MDMFINSLTKSEHRKNHQKAVFGFNFIISACYELKIGETM